MNWVRRPVFGLTVLHLLIWVDLDGGSEGRTLDQEVGVSFDDVAVVSRWIRRAGSCVRSLSVEGREGPGRAYEGQDP